MATDQPTELDPKKDLFYVVPDSELTPAERQERERKAAAFREAVERGKQEREERERQAKAAAPKPSPQPARVVPFPGQQQPAAQDDHRHDDHDDPAPAPSSGDADLDRRLEAARVDISLLTVAVYRATRDKIAAKYNIELSTLNALFDEVRAARKREAVEQAQAEREARPGQGREIEVADPEPWAEPVETAELLAEVRGIITRYVVLKPAAALGVSLYVFLSYIVDHLFLLPLLIIKSAEKRSGKTTLLDVLSRLMRRAIASSSLSEAVLYRLVDAYTPSMLIDEWDRIQKQGTPTTEALYGIIAAGHTRTAARSWRCVPGANGEINLAAFSTFCPKVLCGIGGSVDTLVDRAVVIVMDRKRPEEKVQRFSLLDGGDESARLQSKLARWALDHGAGVAAARPTLPEELHDRARDNWSALVGIADLAGCGPEARDAAALLTRASSEDDFNAKTELLRDVRLCFEAHPNTDRLSTLTIIGWLCDPDNIEAGRWATYNEKAKDQRITPRQVAGLLKGYSVRPKDIKIERKAKMGYYAADLADAWSRYLSPGTPENIPDPRPDADNSLRDKENERSGQGRGSDSHPRPDHAEASVGATSPTPDASPTGGEDRNSSRQLELGDSLGPEVGGRGNFQGGEDTEPADAPAGADVAEVDAEARASALPDYWKDHDPDGRDGGMGMF